MAETNIATAVEIYSAKAIVAMKKAIPRLSSFSTNFTDEFKKTGESINIPLITPDAITKFNATTNNFHRLTAVLSEISLKLQDKMIGGHAITPQQMKRFMPSWWEGKSDLNINSMANIFLGMVADLVTAANYGSAKGDSMSLPLAGFGLRVVADIRAAAIDRGMFVNESTLALNPIYFSVLLSDCKYDVTGDPAIIATGRIPGLLGFKEIIEIPQLTKPGFVCHQDAICVGSAIEDIASHKVFDAVNVITDPDSGFSVQQVIVTDSGTGAMSNSINAVPAVGVGNSKALLRLEK